MRPELTVWLLPLMAAPICWALTPLLRRYAQASGMVDVPDPRRSHRISTPRGGGLAIAVAMLAVLTLLGMWYDKALGLATLTVVLALLGWLDDRFDLAVRWRLIIQVGIAGSLLLWLGGLQTVTFAGVAVQLPWLWSGLALVAVIWLINLHNFMDGSDGLACLQGIWCGLAFGVLFGLAGNWFESLAALSLAAACLGFLYWNRPVARIFMGDTGSILLGGLIAWLALSGAINGSISVWQSLLICSVFVVDASATLVRRIVRGERWYTPHRQHAYQRLIAAGWSHGRVLVLFGLLNGCLVLPATMAGLVFPDWDVWLAVGLTALLGLGWRHVQSASNGEITTHG